MKALLVSLLILLSSVISKAGDFNVTFMGQLLKSNTGELFITIQNINYSLKAQSSEAADCISKLSSGDLISGQGLIQDKTINIRNVERVGLRKILGRWDDKYTSVAFKNFSEASFNFSNVNETKNFKYIVTPSSGNDWKVFFTDNNSVTLGSLDVGDQEVLLKFYDSANGEVTNFFKLKKRQK